MAGQYQYLTATERRELHDLAVAASRELNQNNPGDGNRLMELLRRSLADVQHGRDVAASLRADLRAARRERDEARAAASGGADTCRVVDVDGSPVRVRGGREFTEEDQRHFAEVVRAAKRLYAAENPEQATP